MEINAKKKKNSNPQEGCLPLLNTGAPLLKFKRRQNQVNTSSFQTDFTWIFKRL